MRLCKQYLSWLFQLKGTVLSDSFEMVIQKGFVLYTKFELVIPKGTILYSRLELVIGIYSMAKCHECTLVTNSYKHC